MGFGERNGTHLRALVRNLWRRRDDDMVVSFGGGRRGFKVLTGERVGFDTCQECKNDSAAGKWAANRNGPFPRC